MPDWRFLLFDAISKEPQAEVEGLVGTRYSEVLCGPGAATLVMPLVPRNAAAVTPEMIKPPRAVVAFEKDGALVWSGPVITRDYNLDDDTVTLNCEGWWNYVRRRQVFFPGFTFTNVDQHTIAATLIDYLATWSSGDLGISTAGYAASGVLRTRRYLYYEHQSIGVLVEQLAAVDNGFDFRLSTTWSGGIPNTAMVLRFEMRYPATGRDSGLVFDIGSNAMASAVRDDWSGFATEVVIEGEGTGLDQKNATISNAPLMASTLRLNAVESHTDVTESATLVAYAYRRLKLASQGVADPQIAFGTEYLGELIMGDRVRVRANRGLLELDEVYRIVGWQVDIEADEVRPTLAPLALWTATVV